MNVRYKHLYKYTYKYACAFVCVLQRYSHSVKTGNRRRTFRVHTSTHDDATTTAKSSTSHAGETSTSYCATVNRAKLSINIENNF